MRTDLKALHRVFHAGLLAAWLLMAITSGCGTKLPELTLRLTSPGGTGLEDAPLVVARFAQIRVAARAEALTPHSFDLVLDDTVVARRAVGLFLRPMRLTVHRPALDQSGLTPDAATLASRAATPGPQTSEGGPYEWSDRAAAFAFAKRQAGTVHVEPVARTAPETGTPTLRWRPIRLADPEVLGPADIVAPEVTDYGTNFCVTTKLTESASTRFAAFTESMIGHKVTMSFDDEVAVFPRVEGKITGGLAMTAAWEPEPQPDIVARAHVTAAVLTTGPLASTWTIDGDFVVPAGVDDRPPESERPAIPNPAETETPTPLVQIGDQAIDLQMMNLGDELSVDFPKAGDPRFTGIDMYKEPRFVHLRLGDIATQYGPEPKDTGDTKFAKVMGDLVESRLVADDARARGMKVTDDIGARLKDFRSRFFDPDTRAFDPKDFRQYLRRTGVSLATFDRFVENELLREKVIQQVMAEVTVTDAEVDEQNARERAAVELQVLYADTRAAAALVPIGAPELAAWRRTHERELAKAYEARKTTDFSTPRRLRVRLLQLTAPDTGHAADDGQRVEFGAERVKVAKTARDLWAEVQADQRSAKQATAFAALATRMSADTATAAHGGLVPGDVTMAELRAAGYPKQLVATLETAQPGLSSQPIETDGGFWLAFVERVVEPQVRSYNDVAPELARKLLAAERAPAYIEPLAAEAQALATAQPEAGLDAIATQLNAKARVSDADGAGAGKRLEMLVDETGQSELGRAVRAALATTRPLPLTLSAPVHDAFNPKIVYVVRIVRRVPVTPLDDSERADRKAELLAARQRARYRAWYAALHDKAVREGRLRFTPAYDALVQEGR